MLSTGVLTDWCQSIHYPLPVYGARSSSKLLDQFQMISLRGYTLTAPGFYAPQGRTVRMNSVLPNFLRDVASSKIDGNSITNIEMETAAYYAFAATLGHEMISLNAILANRITHEFSQDPEGQIQKLIELTLHTIA